MKRLLTLVLWLGLTAQGVAAKTVFNYGNGAEPKDLDPHVVTGEPEHNVTMNLFEGLLIKDPKTLEVKPNYAQKWDISKDGKTYTFHLHKGLKFSNGDPITAHDFAYSWLRLIAPATASEYAYHGHAIKGAKDYTAGKIKDPTQVAIKAKDDLTLEVTLENPSPIFLLLVAYHTMVALHKPTIEKHGVRWTRPENMVSSGPFALSKWEVNKVITLKKNPHYWEANKVKLETVNIYGPEKVATEESMFRTGKLDTTLYVPQEKIPGYIKAKDPAFRSYPVQSMYAYRVNVTKPPLNDKRVRKALAWGLDRSRIVKYVTLAGEQPATAYVPPGTGGYIPTPTLPKDGSRVAEAKKLLMAATGGKPLAPIEILYNTDERHKKIAESLQEMWKHNLGVDVRLVNQEWKVSLDTMRTMNYFLGRFSWAADYNDALTYLELYQTDNGNNQTGWSNKEYDDLVTKGSKEMNQKKRNELYRQAENILLDELPIIPIFVYTRNQLVSPKVVGWNDNLETYHPLKLVYFKD